MSDPLTDWLTEWLPDQVRYFLINKQPVHWRAGWVIDGRTEWCSDCVTHFWTEWCTKCLSWGTACSQGNYIKSRPSLLLLHALMQQGVGWNATLLHGYSLAFPQVTLSWGNDWVTNFWLGELTDRVTDLLFDGVFVWLIYCLTDWIRLIDSLI